MEDGQEHQKPDVRDPADQRGPPGQAETQQTQQPPQPQQQPQTQQLPFRPPSQQHPGHYFPQRQHFAGTPQPPYPPQAPLHHGPYDMSAMAPSPANPDYRQHRHHQHQHHQHQQHHQQPQAYGQAPGQPFFFPQPPPGPPAPYYDSPRPSGHVPGPAPNTMPRPHGYGYYPVQGPPPAPYYYPPKLPMYPPQMPLAYSPARPVQPAPMPGPASPQNVARRQSHGQTEAKAASVARGPPMKPKQSGHAIWIGNLPPQTDLMSLVHHVCQKAAGLESLFLIAKSNCAFANFQDEPSCLAAQQSINDTWFASVRLVARLRKSPGDGAPPGAAAGEDGAAADAEARRDREASPEDGDGPPPKAPKTTTSTPTSIVVDGSSAKDAGDGSRVVTPASGSEAAAARDDRFFILKSLTVDDLERSVQTGLWATQAHNEETLNSAFKSSPNVYLFFSANKSGEYFGYARMLSETNPDPAAAIEFAPRTQALSEADLPQAVPTEATATTPRGRIVDDAARGTAFWEAVRDDDREPAGTDDDGVVGDDGDGDKGDTADTAAGTTTAADDPPESSSSSTAPRRRRDRAAADDDDEQPPAKAWGRPFQLAWLSTARLPFYRTRGMRNPLNANREIKIARDGTEVDAAVGRRLIGLFHEAGGGGGGGGGRPFGRGVPPSPY